MNLKKGLQRVTKVLPKEESILSNVRFLPDTKTLYATDGVRGALVQVDCDLPNVMLDGPTLTKAAKDKGDIKLEMRDYNNVALTTGTSNYFLESRDPTDFPPVPQVPDHLVPVDQWEVISGVFHAAAGEKDRPELAAVNFTQGFVEATDKARLARVEVLEPWAGVVPASTFKQWPKGPVSQGFRSGHAFFKIGDDEVRFGKLMGEYPDTARMVPESHAGKYALVPVDELLNAAKQGAAISEFGLVTVQLTDKLMVRAYQEQEDGKRFRADIEAFDRCGEGASAQISGKNLVTALKAFKTPNVFVGFGSVTEPLRLESGMLVVCLWQMV